MRRSAVVVAVLVAVALVYVGGSALLTAPTTSEIAPKNQTAPEDELFRPTGGESGFWPYLNSRPAFEQRSPINVVVVGDTDDVVRLLIESRGADWEETDEETGEAAPGTHAALGGNESTEDGTLGEDGLEIGSTRIGWSRTTGATRYAYLAPGDGASGRWITETAQLHDGSYYGHRYHIRLYESPHPEERWVAMQTHSEHFDWFTLRHRVDGSQTAQTRLERDLMDLPGIDRREDVHRVNLENANASDADGWATFVDLAGVILSGIAIGLSSTGSFRRLAATIDGRLTETDRRRIDAIRERADPRYATLAGTILTVVVGVRFGGIALERATSLSMYVIAGSLYPFVALGLPVGAYLIAADIERRLDAAVVAGGSLAVAFWADYSLLGVRSLPIEVIAHRMFVVIALGLIAGGAALRATRRSRWNALLLAGAALWALLLGGTLFGYA